MLLRAQLASKMLTHKLLDALGYARSIMDTDALVLKYQTIRTHGAGYIVIVLVQFPTKILRSNF